MPSTANAQTHRGILGIQAAEGTAQATNVNLYEFSYGAGKVVAFDKDISAYEVNDTGNIVPGRYTNRIGWHGDPELRGVSPTMAGLLWLALLGSDTVSPAGTHSIIQSNTKPRLTGWEYNPALSGGWWDKGVDGIVTGLEISASGPNPITMKPTILGRGGVVDATGTGPNNANSAVLDPATVLTNTGATLNLDYGAAPATTAFHPESWKITASYSGAQWEQAENVVPTYFDLGMFDVTFEATAKFTDRNAYAATFAGTATAAAQVADATVSPVVIVGSLDFTIPVGPVDANGYQMRIKLPYMEIRVEPYSVDPAGGPVKTVLGGMIRKATSGEAITVVVKNAISAAYPP
jgi:hypothetical protein